MAKLIHVEASPRKKRGHSIAVANAFLEAYVRAHPGDEIETIDLWLEPLPDFDEAANDAKFAVMHGADHSEEQAAIWNAVTRTFRRFAAGDKYLFSVPMWNFGMPYKLKHYIDVITQPGLSFNVTPEGGYQGLMGGKPAVVVYASGGEYASGSPAEAYDLQKPYMRLWLGFIGLETVASIAVAPTMGASEAVAGAEEAALEKARRVAQGF